MAKDRMLRLARRKMLGHRSHMPASRLYLYRWWRDRLEREERRLRALTKGRPGRWAPAGAGPGGVLPHVTRPQV